MMQLERYNSQELDSVLESLKNNSFSGILSVNTEQNSASNRQSHVLIWRKGGIVYGGSQVPTNHEIATTIGKKFQPNLIDTAVQVAIKKINHPNSVQEVIDWLVKLRILKWEQIESYIQERVTWLIEQLLQLSGQLSYNSQLEFDLGFGEDRHSLDWLQLKSELISRQQKWSSFAPLISSINAIPFIRGDALNSISDSSVRQHLEKWVDGQTNLATIANKLDKDPLNIANSYHRWGQAGWIGFSSEPVDQAELQNDDRPIVVCIDDSPIIRTMLNRALSDHYHVLLASNAIEGLNLIYKNPISLVVLDLTMPDIDGLEVCSTIRKIPKFQDLPIIMLTARDGFVNKFKGRMAGSNKYLTKPFNEQELLDTIDDFLRN